jgi:hypothetical protein
MNSVGYPILICKGGGGFWARIMVKTARNLWVMEKNSWMCDKYGLFHGRTRDQWHFDGNFDLY